MPLAKADNPFLAAVRPAALESRFDIRVDAMMVERRLQRGERATDEMLLEAIGWLDPPIVDSVVAGLLARELDGRSNRAGRPQTSKTSLKDIAAFIEQLDRTDIPALFRTAVIDRLRSRERYSDFQMALPRYKKIEKARREDLIASLYRTFQSLIGPDTVAVEYEPLGKLTVPSGNLTPAEKAAELVVVVLREKLNIDPPSRRRVVNIASRYFARFS